MWSRAWLALPALGCHSLFGLETVTLPPDAADAPDVTLTCAQPVPALETKPGIGLVEPGLDESQTIMLVRRDGTIGMHETVRPTRSAQFGAVGAPTLIPAGTQDPTFITIDGKQAAVVAVSPSPRRIAICREASATATCEELTLLDASNGVRIADDTDGPTVAYRDGALVMIFSRGQALFEATPTDSTLATWMATRLELSDFSFDDGALTSDGKLLIAPVGDALFTYRWDAAAATYVAAGMLPIAGNGPEIGVEEGDALELFVTRDDRGIIEPYIASCVRR